MSKLSKKKDAQGFTEGQRRFVEAYVGPARYNATRAAEMAGYSPRTAYSIGHETLHKPHVAAEIKSGLQREFELEVQEYEENER